MLRIVARDGDLGQPEPVALFLEGDDKGFFALRNVTADADGTVAGLLVTSGVPLDREDATIEKNGGIYSFYVRVSVALPSHFSVPPLLSYTNVTIHKLIPYTILVP